MHLELDVSKEKVETLTGSAEGSLFDEEVEDGIVVL